MRMAIIPVLAAFAGLSCGFLAAGQEQGAQQTPPKKEAQPQKGAEGVTDPAEMSGNKPGKPVITGGAPVEKSYTIGAEDVLQLWVIEQSGISGQYTVRPDGVISVPLVGEVRAAGLTTPQLEAAIAERLKANEIIKDPSVAVGLVASHSRKYYVSGEVTKPGQYDLVVPTRVSEALANAGGFREFAKTKSIRIVRDVPGGKPLVFKYNDKEVSHGRKQELNIFLEPGDRIYVD
jgi:polysaccharide export outer membrane protein